MKQTNWLPAAIVLLVVFLAWVIGAAAGNNMMGGNYRYNMGGQSQSNSTNPFNMMGQNNHGGMMMDHNTANENCNGVQCQVGQ